MGMTEKIYVRRFHFPVSSSPFTLASDDVSYIYLSYQQDDVNFLRLFSEERNTYFPDFSFIVDGYGGVQLCGILTMRLDLESFFLWTVSNICV